jgi:hypothetical protein
MHAGPVPVDAAHLSMELRCCARAVPAKQRDHLGGTPMQPSDDHLDPDAVATSAEDGDPLQFASDEDADHDPFTDYPPGGEDD